MNTIKPHDFTSQLIIPWTVLWGNGGISPYFGAPTGPEGVAETQKSWDIPLLQETVLLWRPNEEKGGHPGSPSYSNTRTPHIARGGGGGGGV